MLKLEKLLTAAAANGGSAAFNSSDFSSVIFTVHTTGNAAGTLKFVAGFGDEHPDFSAPSTIDNDWHTVEVIPVSTGTAVAGDTGVVLAGTDIHKAYQMNVDAAKHVGVILSGYSAGVFDVGACKINTNFI